MVKKRTGNCYHIGHTRSHRAISFVLRSMGESIQMRNKGTTKNTGLHGGHRGFLKKALFCLPLWYFFRFIQTPMWTVYLCGKKIGLSYLIGHASSHRAALISFRSMGESIQTRIRLPLKIRGYTEGTEDFWKKHCSVSLCGIFLGSYKPLCELWTYVVIKKAGNCYHIGHTSSHRAPVVLLRWGE